MIEEMTTEDFPREEVSSIETYDDSLGETLSGTTIPMSNQTLFTNGLPLYQFPSHYSSSDNFVDQLGPLSLGQQVLEFPGSLSGYDVF